MRAIQTFIYHDFKSEETDLKHILSRESGWLACEYQWMSWSLSCLQLKKHFNYVELYTNEVGYRILIETLKLPYTSVKVLNDEELRNYPNECWALAKIRTYSLQESPFVHVDGDVFLFQNLDHLKGFDVFGQNVEIDESSYYASVMTQLVDKNAYFPEVIKENIEERPLLALNAGIIGGTNTVFFKEFSKAAFDFVKENRLLLNQLDLFRFNAVYEQLLLYRLALKQKIKLGCMFDEPVADLSYRFLVEFYDAPHKTKYLHLLGHFKKIEEVCLAVGKFLRLLYPEQYYHILKVLKFHGIPFHQEIYNDKKLNPLKHDFRVFLNYSKIFAKVKDKCDFEASDSIKFTNTDFFSRTFLTLKTLGHEIGKTAISSKKVNSLKKAILLKSEIINLMEENSGFRQNQLVKEVFNFELAKINTLLYQPEPTYFYAKKAYSLQIIKRLQSNGSSINSNIFFKVDPYVTWVSPSIYYPLNENKNFLEGDIQTLRSNILIFYYNVDKKEVQEYLLDEVTTFIFHLLTIEISLKKLTQVVKKHIQSSNRISVYSILIDKIILLLNKGIIKAIET